MAESAVMLAIHRMEQSPVASLVSADGKTLAIVPVTMRPGFVGNGVAVNRVHQEHVDNNTHAVVVVTIYAGKFDDAETIGAAVIEALKDSEGSDDEWSYGDAIDVQFEKTGPDCTGWDERRSQYLRSIEFTVSW